MHITHPIHRATNYTLTDTSTLGMFKYGWNRAIACWRSGCTVESITHTATSASPKDRGVIAACEMLMGWHAHGMSREQATRFVAEAAAGFSGE